ncbi:hypothetical protein Glove_46g74 [Diversispora epigaea]|uniref:Uncharacterized protein n=1 Tax=Diversispora epigaea TaxID=1348612 RepID=A0A397JND7_9GLOM|nr:hypothetical protein Glove_46g74 [Diversispora epigaea]
MLPVQGDKYIISNSIDIINNNEIQDDENIQRWFKQKTNLPQKVQLQIGARVIFLNNSEYKHGICNRSIGIITDIDTEMQKVIKSGITDILIRKYTGTSKSKAISNY